MADVHPAMALPGPNKALSREQGEPRGSAKEVVSEKTNCLMLQVYQRREDMTSCHSDNLHALITFQEQELRMQVTRIALWTKSRWAQGVFY